MELKAAGQISLCRFPQTNFASSKLRPVLLIAELPGNYDDWLVCMISSQTHQYTPGLDEIINNDSPDFSQSGLKGESVIRTTRTAVVSGNMLVGVLGEISDHR